jgi:tRNA dimethylallyltransferase
MNIGTAKPTRAELARVPHHLIDCCEVTERMDVTRFVALAREALKDISNRGRDALVVGGSGFYLKSFFGPVADAIEVSSDVRSEVAVLSSEEALKRLRSLNPNGLGSLDTANPRRVTRALERCLASGRTVDAMAEDFAAQPSAFSDWQMEMTRIDREPGELDQRLEDRVAAMLQTGLVDEVRALIGAGLRDNPSAARAIGYREVIDLLEGRIAEDQIAAEIVKNTRGLVKKQRTWFRTQLPAHRVIAVDAIGSVANLFPS